MNQPNELDCRSISGFYRLNESANLNAKVTRSKYSNRRYRAKILAKNLALDNTQLVGCAALVESLQGFPSASPILTTRFLLCSLV